MIGRDQPSARIRLQRRSRRGRRIRRLAYVPTVDDPLASADVNKLGFVLGFVPWIVFSVVAQRLDANGVAWSATIAVAMTVVALVAARRKHGPTFLNLASLVLFGAIAVIGFVGGPAVDRWLFEWGRPLVGVVLGLLVLATASVRPFTAEYARQSVPQRVLGLADVPADQHRAQRRLGRRDPRDRARRRRGHRARRPRTDATRNNTVDLLLNWVVPIAVIWGAMRFTATYPDRVDRAADARRQHDPDLSPRARDLHRTKRGS